MQGQRYSAVAHCRDTLPLSTAGILGCWALQEYLVVSHSRDAWWLGTAGILLRLGIAGIRCKETHRLGTAGILCGCAGILSGWALQGCVAILHCSQAPRRGHCEWALQGYSAVGHCKDTQRLGTAGILCEWALQGYSAVGPFRDALPFCTAVRLRAEGKGIIDF